MARALKGNRKTQWSKLETQEAEEHRGIKQATAVFQRVFRNMRSPCAQVRGLQAAYELAVHFGLAHCMASAGAQLRRMYLDPAEP